MQNYLTLTYKIALLVSLFLLTACGRDELPTPTPTRTPEVTVAIENSSIQPSAVVSNVNPSPTLLNTSQPINTPTPFDHLSVGLRELRYGDYAAARKEFQTLLEMGEIDADLRLQAQFALARGYRADGMFEQALRELEVFTKAEEKSSVLQSQLLPKVWLLRSELQQSIADPSAAIASLNQVRVLYPWAEELTQSEIAAAQASLGNHEEAAVAYQAAATIASVETAKAGWLERSAQAYGDGSLYAEAVGAYDEILSFAKNADYRADIQFRAGQTYASAGDETKAIERWLAATQESPESQAAYLALVELVNRDVAFDLYQRAYIDLNSQAWYPAISAYQGYLESVPITDTRYAAAVHELGQSQLGAEEFDAAIAAFDRVITQFQDCTCLGQAWIDKARTQIARGDNGGGRRTYRIFARQYPADPLAPEALWQSGIRALRDDNRMEAAADFLTLADSFPQSQRAPLALYAVATGAFQGGFYIQSANLHSRLQNEYPDQMSDAVSYWLGRSLAAQGEEEQAKTVWQTVVERTPDMYYGILGAQALQQQSNSGGVFLSSMRTVAGIQSRLEGDDGSQLFAENWLKQGWEMSDASVGILSDTVAADVDLLQGKLLLEVDRRYEGLLFLNRIFDRYQDNPRVLYPLSLEFERIGAYQLSIWSMQRLLQTSPARLIEDAPIFLQKRLFPQPFAELIVSQAQAKKIDPLLYFSLIRQESLFEEGARSGAAAQGLAQIIPDTAHWVAQQLGHPDWSNELIYRPYINLQFGAYYLDWTRNYLDDNIISALVGYNAGPGNAEYWREISGSDDALFVEILGVNEPRIYVQIITSNLYHYTRLYAQPN